MKTADNSTKPSSNPKENVEDVIPSFLKALTCYQSDDPLFAFEDADILNQTFSKSSNNLADEKTRFSDIS
jgi:hypothetical protein